MTDVTAETAAYWDALGQAFYQARATSQYQWCLIIAPAVCEELRREMILQVPYTVMLAHLSRQFGLVQGKRIYQRWLQRKYRND